MKRNDTSNGSKHKPLKTDWKRVRAMKDEDIDCSDIPPLDENFWKNAKLVIPESKVSLGVRFDRNTVAWFKKQGRGYQSRMNAVLTAYVEAQRSVAEKGHKRRKMAS